MPRKLSNNINYMMKGMTDEQRENVNLKRSLSYFKTMYYKWKSGEKTTKPMFYKENRHIRVWLSSMGENPEDFYGYSEKNKGERRRTELENKRKWYENRIKKAKKEYKPKGQGKRKLTDEEVLNTPYFELSDDDKLRQHELHFIKVDIKAGRRCLLCRELFSDEELESRIDNRGNEQNEHVVGLHRRGIEFRLHRTCLREANMRKGKNGS